MIEIGQSTMDKQTNRPTPEQPQSLWTKSIEGYIALALVVLLIGIPPFAPEPKLQVQLDPTFRVCLVAAMICLWGFACLFAYSGVKRGQGAAWAAALLSMILLGGMLMLVLGVFFGVL